MTDEDAKTQEIRRLRAKVRELQKVIADIVDDSEGNDAPINRGLDSVQAAKAALGTVPHCHRITSSAGPAS